MRSWLVGSVLLFNSIILQGQIRFIIDSLPKNSIPVDTLFMASSLNRWNPHDTRFAFSRDDKNRLVLSVDNAGIPIEYKITRGSWNKVEVRNDGSDIQNRLYKPELGGDIQLKISGWKDLLPAKPKVSTASKGVAFMSSNIEIPQLNRRRTIRMYFPPNYSSGRRFPVIYMHDGQNLFDNATAFAGEWNVDETLDSLYQLRGFSCIVVGIYNSDKYRMNEYLPWSNDSLDFNAEGETYAKFIVKTLKPFIDSHYRSLPDRDNTVIMGSSMGGLISMYMALEYPEIFGKAAIYSPSFWIAPKVYQQIDKFKMRKNQKIFILAGGMEDERMVRDIRLAEDKLRKVGFDEHLLVIKIDSLGRHNEQFWGKEFGNTIKYLFNL